MYAGLKPDSYQDIRIWYVSKKIDKNSRSPRVQLNRCQQEYHGQKTEGGWAMSWKACLWPGWLEYILSAPLPCPSCLVKLCKMFRYALLVCILEVMRTCVYKSCFYIVAKESIYLACVLYFDLKKSVHFSSCIFNRFCDNSFNEFC